MSRKVMSIFGGHPTHKHLLLRNESFYDVYFSLVNFIQTEIEYLYFNERDNLSFSEADEDKFNMPSLCLKPNVDYLYPNFYADYDEYYFFDIAGNLLDPNVHNIKVKVLWTRCPYNKDTEEPYKKAVLRWDVVQNPYFPRKLKEGSGRSRALGIKL